MRFRNENSTSAFRKRRVDGVRFAIIFEDSLGLGQERASSVGTFLRNNGVEESHVKTRSRDEADAAGNDAEGWAGGRRVDILLAY